jgi:hypothetical protein
MFFDSVCADCGPFFETSCFSVIDLASTHHDVHERVAVTARRFTRPCHFISSGARPPLIRGRARGCDSLSPSGSKHFGLRSAIRGLKVYSVWENSKRKCRVISVKLTRRRLCGSKDCDLHRLRPRANLRVTEERHLARLGPAGGSPGSFSAR